MQRALILFGFVSLLGGCGRGASPAVAPAPAPALTSGPRTAEAVTRVEATGCRAEPSTVYGEEPVVFQIDAPSPTAADVELFDASGRSVARARLPAPGPFRPPPLPSGDFVLKLGAMRVECHVTVNRELSRATEAKR